MNVRLGEIAELRTGPSRSGRSAAAGPGDRKVALISGSDIWDDRLGTSLPLISIPGNELTERHLLAAYDVVVTGKSTAVKAAYVPPDLGPTIANSTLVVVHPHDPDLGVFLWWYLTSPQGRRELESRMIGSATIASLPPAAVARVEVPVPERRRLHVITEMIETSEKAYLAALGAAEQRRMALRAALVRELANGR
ncbi:MAG TPA: restriction endonuclease subunit S [Gemmatimonadales bacterium]|nr:restriction endonuclease subunit S [Gemmatimonadales bacterium]